jgi:hypothetical protein
MKKSLNEIGFSNYTITQEGIIECIRGNFIIPHLRYKKYNFKPLVILYTRENGKEYRYFVEDLVKYFYI